MRKIFGKIIMTQRELNRELENARVQGRREAQKTLSREKQCIMINCGFFPVTDSFWEAIGTPEIILNRREKDKNLCRFTVGYL